MSSPERILGDDDFDAEVERLFDEIASVEESFDKFQESMSLEQVRANLLDKLPLYDVVPQVVASDNEHQARLFAEYTTRYREQAVYNLQFSPKGVDETDYPRIASDMIIAYYDEREFQTIVVHCAASITNAYINNIEGERDRFIDQSTKKELQADFMLHYGRKADDPMLVFFAHETPGANLDTTDPEDKRFLNIAQAKYEKFQLVRTKRNQILDAAKGLLGLDEESGEEEMAYVTHVLIEMLLEASLTQTGRPSNRTERLTEMARLLGRSNVMTNAVVGLIEAHYPMQQQ